MNRAVLILVSFTTILFFGHTAFAFCNCRQAYYKDEIDLITSYTRCLEQCYNLQITDLKSKLDISEKKIAGLESEMNDIKLRIKYLEEMLSSIKTKNKSKP